MSPHAFAHASARPFFLALAVSAALQLSLPARSMSMARSPTAAPRSRNCIAAAAHATRTPDRGRTTACC